MKSSTARTNKSATIRAVLGDGKRRTLEEVTAACEGRTKQIWHLKKTRDLLYYLKSHKHITTQGAGDERTFGIAGTAVVHRGDRVVAVPSPITTLHTALDDAASQLRAALHVIELADRVLRALNGSRP